ncbi:titin, putative [Ixodes scapularis]|uniref:Titin, putative n=1 Tax=Ixodes scapularis TaxID=6945 RepID=B7QCZ2_IXOSC|nr:titin, putative [Ixodes scapularis]|eukprot:XP_002413406.1 titin, putative [Ixodes scapularis]
MSSPEYGTSGDVRAACRRLEEELSCQAKGKAQREEASREGGRSCSLCSAAFNLLFNRKLVCRECGLCVCRDCAAYDSRDRAWYCRLCDQQRSLRAQSCEWFYDNVKVKFNHFGSTKVLLSLYGPKNEAKATDDLEATEQEQLDVQQHVETVIEGLVGESLDSASVSRLYKHPLYEKFLSDHQELLREGVAQFTRALLIALQGKPFEADLTPTSTHARDDGTSTDQKNSSGFSDMSESDDGDDVFCDTYEDLLVMAVMNKVVEMAQRKYEVKGGADNSGKVCEPDIIRTAKKELMDVGCQSDIPLSDSGQEEEEFTAEETESDEFLWARVAKQDPFKYIIEEKIEEEITEAYTESEDERNRNALSDAEECSGSGVDVPFTLDPSREHRKKRSAALGAFRGGRYAAYYDPINMVIPNPASDYDRVRLGSRDLDELSEMSEKLSVGSLELSSASDSEEEEEEEKTAVAAATGAANGSAAPPTEKPIKRTSSSSVMEVPTHWRFSGPPSDETDCNGIPKPKPRRAVVQKPPEPSTDAKRGSSKPKQTRSAPKREPVSAAKIVLKQLRVPDYAAPDARRQSKDPSLRFISRPEAKTSLHAGKTAKFVCEITSPKLLGVAWFRGRERLVPNERCRTTRLRGREYVLEIYDANKGDEGTYSAVAYSDRDEVWCDFALAVRATSRASNAPDFTVAPHVVEPLGEPCVQLSCTVSGYPEPRVWFLRDDLPLPDGEEDRFSLENKGYGEWCLRIESPSSEDEAEYVAVASNSLGQKLSRVTFRLGSIAEREHAKWLNAVPLRNNPYSTENLAKRASQSRRESLATTKASSFEGAADEEGEDDAFSPPPLPSSYLRDYYVNNPRLVAKAETPLARKTPPAVDVPVAEGRDLEETLHSFEEQSAFPDKKVILEEKGLNGQEASSGKDRLAPPKPQEPWSIKKVHSLTARSLPREFREHAQRNLVPRQMNRTVVASPPSPTSAPNAAACEQLFQQTPQQHQQAGTDAVGGDLTPGYASDESSTSSSLGGGGVIATARSPSGGGKRRSKAGSARGILQRTSYWERRVEQGLLSDSSVTEEFPPLHQSRPANTTNGAKS